MGDIIDFRAVIEAREKEGQHPILTALDALALALVDHGHTWTDQERLLYETAVSYIIGPTPPETP